MIQPYSAAFALAVALLALGSPARAESAEARELMQKAVEALPNASFKARVRLTGDYRADRVLTAEHKVVDGTRATYLEVVEPDFLVGMRFLFRQQPGQPPKQHMRYIASKMPVLVAADTRAEPFLGSSFSLVDLVEPDLDAFTFELTGTDTVGGRRCKLVQATPKDPADEVYGKVVHCVDPETFVVLQREFFDPKGKKSKVWTGSKIEKVEGNWTVLDQRMRDVPRDVESRMEIVQIDYGVELPDSTFTTEYLTR